MVKWLIGYYYECGIKKEVDADGARKICDMCEAIKKSMSLTPTDGLGISNSDLDQIGAKSYYDVDRVLQTLTCKKCKKELESTIRKIVKEEHSQW